MWFCSLPTLGWVSPISTVAPMASHKLSPLSGATWKWLARWRES